MVKKHRVRTCSRNLPPALAPPLASTLLYLAYLTLALREEKPPRSYEDFHHPPHHPAAPPAGAPPPADQKPPGSGGTL